MQLFNHADFHFRDVFSLGENGIDAVLDLTQHIRVKILPAQISGKPFVLSKQNVKLFLVCVPVGGVELIGFQIPDSLCEFIEFVLVCLGIFLLEALEASLGFFEDRLVSAQVVNVTDGRFELSDPLFIVGDFGDRRFLRIEKRIEIFDRDDPGALHPVDGIREKLQIGNAAGLLSVFAPVRTLIPAQTVVCGENVEQRRLLFFLLEKPSQLFLCGGQPFFQRGNDSFY